MAKIKFSGPKFLLQVLIHLRLPGGPSHEWSTKRSGSQGTDTI
jgi:hypothetical protein